MSAKNYVRVAVGLGIEHGASDQGRGYTMSAKNYVRVAVGLGIEHGASQRGEDTL